VTVENSDLPPQGGGEPAIVNMSEVIASAIHDATGSKLLQLPMTPERVKAEFAAVWAQCYLGSYRGICIHR